MVYDSIEVSHLGGSLGLVSHLGKNTYVGFGPHKELN